MSWHFLPRPAVIFWVFLAAAGQVLWLADVGLCQAAGAGLLRTKATESFFEGRYDEAESLCGQILALEGCSERKVDLRCCRVFMNLAVCRMMKGDHEGAKHILDKLLRALASSKSGAPAGDLADCLYWYAECWYRRGNTLKARDLFKQSLVELHASVGQRDASLLPCLEALAGCEYSLKNFRGAAELYKQALEIRLGLQTGDTLGLCDLLLSLADCLDRLEECEKAAALRDVGISLYRAAAGDYLLARYDREAAEKGWSGERSALVRHRIEKFVVGASTFADALARAKRTLGESYLDRSPVTSSVRSADFSNWQLPRPDSREDMELVTIDLTVDQKAFLVCIHGLSLHSKAFSDFAARMAPRGFAVVTLNMRGFGTNLFSKGSDKFDPGACVEDIRLVLSLMRRDNPGVPIFLLGESTGGALAINTAARYPELMDGVICSVPSGKRFGAFSEGVLVAGQYLSDPKRPFDIGSRIIRQATADPAVRHTWSSDPLVRKELSADELIALQSFLDESERLAREVKRLPVMMFQGLSDHLVSPEGTAQVYLSLATQDKDLIVLGKSEHLIFEIGQTPAWVIDALCSWIESRLGALKRQQS